MKMKNYVAGRRKGFPETCLSQKFTVPSMSIPEESLTEILQFRDFYDYPHPDSVEEFEKFYLEV